jgi:hypothetical protein
MSNDGIAGVVDLQEAVEKAFKAGFECYGDNAEVQGWNEGQIGFEERFSFDKAVTDYINGNL